MSAAAAIGRLARTIGIVAVFTLVGPVLLAAMFALSIVILAAPILDLLFFWIDWRALRPIALFLLVFFALVATVPASFAVGLAFAVASVYFGARALSVALLIVALAAAGLVALGSFMPPSESSPLILPGVRDLSQGAALWLFLTVPGAIAAAICWLMSRPLHRPS
jgi:hypothetical protein